MTRKKQVGTEAIESAIGRFKRDRMKAVELEIDDEAIREMLRPKTIIERNPRALPILRVLKKYGEIPGPVLAKIYGVESKNQGTGVAHSLVSAGYIACERGVFSGRNCNIFSLTAKGRQVLKQARTH